MSELEKAARALVAALDKVHADRSYQAAWELSQVHRGPYYGRQYTRELADLRAALEAEAGWETTDPIPMDTWPPRYEYRVQRRPLRERGDG